MLDDTQHAAGFERAKQGGEGLRGGIPGQPVMDVPERHDHVERTRGYDIAAVVRKSHDLHSRIQIGAPSYQAMVLRKAFRDVPALRIRCDDRRVILAVRLQQRREHLGVPARFRPDLQHLHFRPQTEEQQRLLRMAVAIAGTVGFGALAARQHFIERRRGALAGARGRAAHGEHHSREGCAGKEQEGRFAVIHRRASLERRSRLL